MRKSYTTILASLFAITSATSCISENETKLESVIIEQKEVIDQVFSNYKVEHNQKQEEILQCCSDYRGCAEEKNNLWKNCEHYTQGCWKHKYLSIRGECIPQFRSCLDSANADELDKEIIKITVKGLEQQEQALITLESYFPNNFPE